MSKEMLTFGDTENQKRTFHSYKSPIFKKDANISNILMSNKISSSL